MWSMNVITHVHIMYDEYVHVSTYIGEIVPRTRREIENEIKQNNFAKAYAPLERGDYGDYFDKSDEQSMNLLRTLPLWFIEDVMANVSRLCVLNSEPLPDSPYDIFLLIDFYVTELRKNGILKWCVIMII